MIEQIELQLELEAVERKINNFITNLIRTDLSKSQRKDLMRSVWLLYQFRNYLIAEIEKGVDMTIEYKTFNVIDCSLMQTYISQLIDFYKREKIAIPLYELNDMQIETIKDSMKLQPVEIKINLQENAN
jgi:hypothetical protein